MMVLESSHDRTVNTIFDEDIGFLETRQAHKGHYDVIYLSSQTGCNQGCKFCHLTASRQTVFKNASLSDLLKQAAVGLSTCSMSTVHFNYMARGEPLLNPNIHSDTLTELSRLALKTERIDKVRHLISTILPRDFVTNESLTERFPIYQPEIYYSLYTTDDYLRKRFMPNASSARDALKMLKEWQDFSNKLIYIHFSIVPFLNDSLEQIRNVVDAVKSEGLNVRFNIVEYNSPDAEESPPMISSKQAAAYINEFYPQYLTRYLPRIGYDVYASCGMFYGSDR